MAERWHTDPQYTHGYLVPLFAGYLLWARRDRLTPDLSRPHWSGLFLLIPALGLHFAGTFFYVDWLTAIAWLPSLAGLCVLVAGWPALRWAGPALAFLVFMVPLPYRLEVMLVHPLRRIATLASTYCLQTLGFSAISEGNTIRMGEVQIGVVEACSGLSMLVVFFALAAAVVLLIKQPWYEKLLIFASAVPIALVANIVRITATGILHKTVGRELADYVFHELAGWLMPLLALGLLWVELRLLGWVLVARPISELPKLPFGVPHRPTGPAPKAAVAERRPGNGRKATAGKEASLQSLVNMAVAPRKQPQAPSAERRP